MELLISGYPSIIDRGHAPGHRVAVGLADDRTRKPAPHIGRMRPAHLDPVAHPPLRAGMPPPLRFLGPRLDEPTKLVHFLSPLKPPRDGLARAKFRRDRLSNAAHAGNQAKQGQTEHAQFCTCHAHIQHVTMCGIRSRCISLSGLGPPSAVPCRNLVHLRVSLGSPKVFAAIRPSSATHPSLIAS